MDKLKLQLEYCYGIRKLDVVLDFGGNAAIAIYAPNGSMKSSLASTFQDIADGKASRDRIFPNRATVRVVQDENSANIGAANVLVLRPYEEFSSKGNATATLLVNAALRQEYEALHAGVTAARVGFVFKDGNDHAPVERDALLQTLSTGEKKAFHVLNMLFDIEVRRAAGQQTLLVVDDIADSFDYKNKYAIVQYLSDLAEHQHFKLLILTHNFDFYRTIESRRLIQRKNCFMVSKTTAGVTLEEAQGVRNVFINVWKPAFFTDDRMKICCVPFMRNLIEYTKGEADPDYLLLTSLLHWKTDTDQITVADLDGIYTRLFGTAGQSGNAAAHVVDLLAAEVAACLQAPDGINFENKVVLAMATRLQAERFMAAKINDAAWLASIAANQTPVLLRRYCADFPTELANVGVIQRVLLMTPENIHLNSFMYEPILDMSDQHLRRLHAEVVALV